MEGYPQVFDAVFVNLVRAGEVSGRVAEVLRSITENLKWADEQAAHVKKLLMYPAMVGTVVIAVIFFLMVYLATWLRRSNVLTGGEWMRTRFGTGRGAELSHIAVVVFALTSVIGFLAYAFQGIGKFCEVFLPWELSAAQYAMIFMTVTTVYVILGGMYRVVITDLVQFTLLTVSSVAIAIIAVSRTTREQITAAVPGGWEEIFFGWHLDLDWSALIPGVDAKIAADGYGLFGAFFMMMLFKGVLSSMAGPASRSFRIIGWS